MASMELGYYVGTVCIACLAASLRRTLAVVPRVGVDAVLQPRKPSCMIVFTIIDV